MASSKKATTQRDILNYTKTEKENLCKALSIAQMYEGGIINGMMVFNKKHSAESVNTRFYICDKCAYARKCNSMSHAKMIERLHKKKCKKTI